VRSSAVHSRPRITTYTGLVVNPLDLQPSDVRIEDIAHALALINRFCGHTAVPISVAQHSVHVSRLCNGAAFQGLLHDAAEAYLNDITKWVKAAPEMAPFRAAEARAQRVILERFGCEPELADEVEVADRLMVRYEYERGYNGRVIDRPAYPRITEQERRLVGPWEPWAWDRAERAFLARFKELSPSWP
jgi:hypothetical protein